MKDQRDGNEFDGARASSRDDDIEAVLGQVWRLTASRTGLDLPPWTGHDPSTVPAAAITPAATPAHSARSQKVAVAALPPEAPPEPPPSETAPPEPPDEPSAVRLVPAGSAPPSGDEPRDAGVIRVATAGPEERGPDDGPDDDPSALEPETGAEAPRADASDWVDAEPLRLRPEVGRPAADEEPPTGSEEPTAEDEPIGDAPLPERFHFKHREVAEVEAAAMTPVFAAAPRPAVTEPPRTNGAAGAGPRDPVEDPAPSPSSPPSDAPAPSDASAPAAARPRPPRPFDPPEDDQPLVLTPPPAPPAPEEEPRAVDPSEEAGEVGEPEPPEIDPPEPAAARAPLVLTADHRIAGPVGSDPGADRSGGPPAGDDPDPFDEADEEVLQALVQRIVREEIRAELRGDLGLGLTRTVRKLVRQEVNRVLAAQRID